MVTLPETGYELLALDPEYTGSCPCATIEVAGESFDLHCWRVCSKCDGCGVHYVSNKDLAMKMAALLTEMDWYGEWSVRQGHRR